MKINTLLLLVLVIVSACKDKYDVSSYHSSESRDSLLADIITYVYVRAPYSDSKTRFESRFRKYYVDQLGQFRFEKYYVDARGLHYFYLIRPARSADGNIRGVLGTFRMDDQGKIYSFREILNTPIAPLPVLQQRGEELFNSLVKRGHVDDYLKHPDYVEWPDKITYYDTIQYEWLVKPGI